MRKRILFILTVTALVGGCEPFQLSIFPAFLTDLSAVRDLSGSFAPAEVEHFELSALNNGVADSVFLMAACYNGERRLLMFNGDLEYGGTASDTAFGSRHTVDITPCFVQGRMVFSLSPGYTPQYLIPSTGPDGFAAVMRKSTIDFYNTLLESNGSTVSFIYHTPSWTPASPSPTPDYRAIGSNAATYYELIYGRWFVNLEVGPAVVLVFRSSSPEKEGYAVVINQGYDFPDSPAASPADPLIGGALPCDTIALGPIEYEVSVAYAGVLALGRDGALRLFGWDKQVKALTRAYDAGNRFLIDYGMGDYYYVFDPGTLKLYKARNWWLKNS